MQNELDTLRKQLAEKDAIIARQQQRLSFLEEQFRLAQQKRFGASSESYPGQGELFNEAEEVAVQIDEGEQETISYTRKKPKRKPLPADLPREVVIHDIDDADKVCGCCDNALHKIGEDKSEKLEFIPAQVKVIEHVRPKYACKHCEKNGTANTIKQAPVPSSIIPKGYATPSLLSQLITSKYQYGLPLYRQEAMFKQYGIELSRQTMSDWMMKCAELFKPLYDRLHELILEQPVIAADETTLKVVKEDKTKCYMWLYCTGTDSPDNRLVDANIPNIVLYDYNISRAGKCAVDYLRGYSGYLQEGDMLGMSNVSWLLGTCST